MTYELNIHSVSAQAERLEQDVRELVQSTSEDKAFRKLHEQRLQALWVEILAVKTRMDEVTESQESNMMDVEQRKAETKEIADEFRREVIDIKDTMSAISLLFGRLPSEEQTDDEQETAMSSQTETSGPKGPETRAMAKARANTQTLNEPRRVPEVTASKCSLLAYQ